jgi:PAS domain S-box-containing protein
MAHISATIPKNEKERLASLYCYNILDTGAEKVFDDIVNLAAEICETPIALISLVEDQRQWFKAKVGLEANETSRDVSFCAHAILGNNPFIVEDATKDSRFAENPLVLNDPNIRFYAGIPLTTPDQQQIGTLCVIDNKPRQLKAHQLQIIQLLSKNIITHLELRRQTALLSTSEARLKLATTISKIGIWDWDINSNALFWDDSMLEIYGIPKSEFIGAYQTWSEAIFPEDKERTENELLMCVKGEKKYDTIFRIKHRDGTIHHIKATGVVNRKDDGTPIKVVGTNIDITEQCEHEAELERLRSAADAANIAKSQFLAHMSHEIRSPLTSIIGFAEAAKDSHVSELDRINAFETIFKNGQHLLGIINDILDLSKIDAGALKIELLPFSPIKIIQNASALLKASATSKGIKLNINYPLSLPETITSDSLRLMQILVNLLSNAIKFTDSGSVELTMNCERESEKLYCSVTDSGIGITTEQLSRLFNPFTQADTSTTRRYGGTGLGLSITKKLIEKLGGEISVTSVPNKGSTFSFFIKTGDLSDVNWITGAAAEEQNTNPVTNIPELNIIERLNGKVLFADDTPDNRKLIEFTLRKSKIDLKIVENGAEALEAALAEKFDLIILDMQMPIMDGYTAARELRRVGCSTPIVAFTADAMKEDVIKCLEAGCTSHLAKPFAKKALIECIYRQLKN